MLRIRRKLIFGLCGIFSFLCFYYYFTKFQVFQNFEQKLQRLENGMERYGKEMKHLKTRLDQNWKNSLETNEINMQQQKQLKKPPHQKEFKEAQLVQEECENVQQIVPQTDLQMLDLYDKMSFADIDGGVWKQGWDIKYDPLRYNEHHKLKVFVVPHSHNDPGWIKTFDDYYEHDTKHILSNALRHLKENPDMKFIWAEISYFSRFFEELGENNKKDMRDLIQNGQLEFVTGGWVMPDEANSHWLSVLLQLTEGQTWLKKHVNVTPTSSWAIDPFGHSPTLPYVLKKSGFQNLLIQRTHYSVKKILAQEKQLEFYWRQLWEDTTSTDLFTHMMPFYSYDIPHTCGPDPKICCQFDFKRMQGFGLSCPWRVPPQRIDENNVAQRAEMLVEQWKKKAELYRTNILLIPLGDDFRYSQSTEWDVQRMNYEALFEFINSDRRHFVEAKFGTLQEYFDAVHREERLQKREFPILSGDFFTYADRADNYWSGYYTSRPYHKRMDRVLLHYVRSAEMLSSWHNWDDTKFNEMLQKARRELSLFQHHDGITGTAKTHVVQDYARRMLDSIKSCKFVMQQAVYRLLTKPSIYNADYKFNYFYLDDSRWPGPDDSRTTIILGEELPIKHVVLHNSQPQWREDIIDFYVSTPYVWVSDFNDNAIEAQVNPVWTWHRHTIENTVTITPQASTTKYRLIFKVNVPPLGLMTYKIMLQTTETKNSHTTFGKNLILTTTPISVNMGEYPEEIKFTKPREISLHVSDGPAVVFNSDGHMKSIQIDAESPHTPVHLKFYKYGTRISGDRSGAYLFIPNGPATAFVNIQQPIVLVSEGKIEASITAGLPFVIHQTILRGNQSPEIRNLVDITNMDNTEIVMRLSTRIQSGDVFYTDLNGLQLIKRKRFSKIPLQANYYPVPSAMYIEDDTTRLTLLSAQPLGGSSLEQGELEIMQDRRLTHDDERGLGQGVLDNQQIIHIFRVVLEKIDICNKLPENHPGGALTTQAYYASKSILNPLDKFIFSENDWLGIQRDFGAKHVQLDDDMEIVAIRNLESTLSLTPNAHVRNPLKFLNTGIIVHRTNLLHCAGDSQRTGSLNVLDLLQLHENVTSLQETSLTFLQKISNLETTSSTTSILCPMDSKAFIVECRS